MTFLLAFLFSLALLFGSWMLGVLIGVKSLTTLLVIGTSVWVYIDANKLRLSDYRTGLTNSAIAAFASFVLWPLGFPWYLSIRHSILQGKIRPVRIPFEDERDPWVEQYPR